MLMGQFLVSVFAATLVMLSADSSIADLCTVSLPPLVGGRDECKVQRRCCEMGDVFPDSLHVIGGWVRVANQTLTSIAQRT